MPARKKRSFGEAAAVAKATDKKAIENPAEPPPKKSKAKTTTKAGRTPTVDYKRDAKLFVSITQDLFDRLEDALLAERKKRRPAKVDKGVLIQEAVEAWLKKSKY